MSTNNLKQYYALIKNPATGAVNRAYVTAEHTAAAKALFEGMYGAKNVLSNPLDA
jgi:hypothetical protein